MLKFSKEKQLGKKMKKINKTGAKTETPVQNFIDNYLKCKGLFYLRFPDGFWQYIHNPINKIKVYFKKLCSDSFAGYPDNMVFENLTDKYLIALPIEAKSKTGKLNGNKQKRYAKKLNYQIPRSEDEARILVDNFEKDIEKIKKILKENGF